MEGLLLGRIAALVPEFVVKDLPLGRTLMMMYEMKDDIKWMNGNMKSHEEAGVKCGDCQWDEIWEMGEPRIKSQKIPTLYSVSVETLRGYKLV